MEILNKLKNIAEQNNINQEQIARDLGVTFATLNRWLNGKAIPRKKSEDKIKTFISNFSIKSGCNNYESYLQDFSSFDNLMLSENELKCISDVLMTRKNSNDTLLELIVLIPEFGKNYDWNIGSILQHFDPELVIDLLKKIDNIPKYYNSIGLCWALGELNRKDQFVLNFLYSVLRFSSNPEALWRAAFSIENIEGDEDAIVLLKRNVKIDQNKDITYFLDNLKDKRSIIAILIKSNTENTQTIIYPKLKEVFINTKNNTELINCCWLIGRLNLIDKDILNKIKKNLNTTNYELKYYTYFALQHNSNETLRPLFEKELTDEDPLIRKMSCRALRKLGGENSLSLLEVALLKEQDPMVISELSKAIYSIKNPKYKSEIILQRESIRNENGMISDETDKWYKDSSIYNLFSEAEDPQNICFDLIVKFLKDFKVNNPIDLATGTGRYLFQIRRKIDYSGTLYGIDYSESMCSFIEKKIRREKMYVSDIKIVKSSIEDFDKKIKIKSNLIISSFGFPSRISDKGRVFNELKAVYNTLSDDGYFITVGWDETFNDELNYMWYKYIPDNISAKTFEEWRRKRAMNIDNGSRNCNLTWFKKGLNIPLQFTSIQEASSVMGYLFGRDAAKSIIKKNKIDWNMSMGITIDTKESLKDIIKKYERNRNTL